MTYNRKLGLFPWAENAILDSLTDGSPELWTEEKMESLYEWAQKAIVSRRMLDRVRDSELWIEDFREGEPVFSERLLPLRLVPKPEGS